MGKFVYVAVVSLLSVNTVASFLNLALV